MTEPDSEDIWRGSREESEENEEEERMDGIGDDEV
jgi:hypothetical protein